MEKGLTLLLVAPIYAKPKKKGNWLGFHLMRATKTLACKISDKITDPEVPAVIFTKFHYLGLKEASGNMDYVRAFKAAAPTSPLYCGDDNLILNLYRSDWSRICRLKYLARENASLPEFMRPGSFRIA